MGLEQRSPATSPRRGTPVGWGRSAAALSASWPLPAGHSNLAAPVVLGAHRHPPAIRSTWRETIRDTAVARGGLRHHAGQRTMDRLGPSFASSSQRRFERTIRVFTAQPNPAAHPSVQDVGGTAVNCIIRRCRAMLPIPARFHPVIVAPLPSLAAPASTVILGLARLYHRREGCRRDVTITSICRSYRAIGRAPPSPPARAPPPWRPTTPAPASLLSYS